MPSLKECVESIFKLSSSQAVPSTKTVSVNVSASGEEHTAPFDGFVCFSGDAQCSFVEISWDIIKTSSFGNNGEWPSVTISVRKGTTVRFNFEGTGALFCNFIASVGAS